MDLLVEKKSEQKKKVWERSIGSLGGGSKLGLLVKKKKPANIAEDSLKTTVVSTEQPERTCSGNDFKTPGSVAPLQENRIVPSKEATPAGNSSVPGREVKPPGNSSVVKSGSALGLLGAYSDSDSGGSD